MAVPCARMANIELINTIGVAKENRTACLECHCKGKHPQGCLSYAFVSTHCMYKTYLLLLPDFCRWLRSARPECSA